jgi:hypothetical protein
MKVGSIVHLVDDRWEYFKSKSSMGIIYPVKNKDYTVREILKGRGALSGIDCIRLEEIVNKTILYLDSGVLEQAFQMYRFKELLPPISDIEETINANVAQSVECGYHKPEVVGS